MSETYTRPEIRELGTLTALTLGSTHGGAAGYTKDNNTAADTFTGPGPFTTGDRGSNCVLHLPPPIGNIPCS